MNASSLWLPLLTFVGGFVAKSIQDWLQDRQTAMREREARLEARRDTYFAKRAEFQRETILGIQDVAQKMIRNAGQLSMHDIEWHIRSSLWQEKPLPAEIDQAGLEQNAMMNKLAVRLADGEARRLVQSFRDACTRVGLASKPAYSKSALREAGEQHLELNARLGELLRSLDDLPP
jgi:hypothetical protein